MADVFFSATEYDPYFLLKKLRDACVQAGWQDVTPAGAEPEIVGYFLESVGENGNTRIPIHFNLGPNKKDNLNTMGYYLYVNFLSSAISELDTTIPLESAANFPASGGVVRIGDELVYYTGVSGSSLIGVTRGYKYNETPGTSNGPAAAHSAGDVVSLVYASSLTTYNSQLFGEIYMFRDLNTPLASGANFNGSSKSSVTWAATLGSRDVNSYFDYHTLLRLGSAAPYVWRWVRTHTFSAGTHTFNIDKTPLRESEKNLSEGALVSGGMFPGYSRRQTSSAYCDVGPVNNCTYSDPASLYFVYINKDRIVIIVRTTYYTLTYIGQLYTTQNQTMDMLLTNPTIEIVTLNSSGYSNCVISDIGKIVNVDSNAAGILWNYDNTSRVWYIRRTDNLQTRILSGNSIAISAGSGGGTASANAAIYGFLSDTFSKYYPNEKVRIVSQTVNDQLNSRNLALVEESGWPLLDPEEIPTEELVVGLRIPRSVTITFEAAGYVDAVAGDEGSDVVGYVDGTPTYYGYLYSFDNVTRTWVVYPKFDAEYWFTNATTVNISGSSKGGTVSSVNLSADGVIKSGAWMYYIYSQAVVSTHPFPFARSAFVGGEAYTPFDMEPVYGVCKGSVLKQHSSHRQHYRAIHASGNKFSPYSAATAAYRPDLYRVGDTSTYEYVGESRIPGIGKIAMGTDYSNYGVFLGVYGFCVGVYFFDATLQANSEDYFLAKINDSYKIYRLFNIATSSGGYYPIVVGPEN